MKYLRTQFQSFQQVGSETSKNLVSFPGLVCRKPTKTNILVVFQSYYSYSNFNTYKNHTEGVLKHTLGPKFVWLVFGFFSPIYLFKINLFIFGCAGSSLPCRLFSSCREQGLLFVKCCGFSCCRVRALCWRQQLRFEGSRAQAQQLWRIGLVVPWHVGSSWTRDQTYVSCIGRWILYHQPTREAICHFLISKNSLIQGFPGHASGKESACQYRRCKKSLGQEDPLQKEMAPYSCILAWKIPWAEEPGGLQSMGLQKVGHE